MGKSVLNFSVLLGLLATSPLLEASNYSFDHHWDVWGDFVFMRRSEVHNHALVKDANAPQSDCPNACPNHTVISTKNLVNSFDFEPGYRVGLAYSPNSRVSIEGNFLWLEEWHGEKKVHGDQSLNGPFESGFTEDYSDADEATATYESQFWDAELNFWRYFTPKRADYFSIAVIGGLRYFHLNESFSLTMVSSPDKSTFHTHTENRMPGAQVGLDFQMNPSRWLNWEMFAKVGSMVNWAEVKVVLRDEDNQVVLSDFNRDEWEWGFFADVAAQFAIYWTKWLNFHAGYEVFFFSGLALAPEQVSKKAGRREYIHGGAIIHGLYGGLTFSF